MHFIQAVMGHSSVSIAEKYYAQFSPTVLEGGRRRGKKVANRWQKGVSAKAKNVCKSQENKWYAW